MNDEALEALAEMSEEITEQTDIFPQGADIVVTKGAGDGNEVTAVLHRPEDSDADDIVVGFEEQSDFDHVVRRFTGGSSLPLLEVSSEEADALDELVEAGAWELPPEQEDEVRRLRERIQMARGDA